MEKLIEYLNQHRIELCDGNTTNLIRFKYSPYTFNLGDLGEQNTELLVISKQYGFIKRLVEYDKIDYAKEIDEEVYSKYYDGKTEKSSFELIVDDLVMELSIKEKPIEFLVSILI